MIKDNKSGAVKISTVFGSLSCWLWNRVVKRGFLDIYITTSLAVRNFGNTWAMKVVFFLKKVQNLI